MKFRWCHMLIPAMAYSTFYLFLPRYNRERCSLSQVVELDSPPFLAAEVTLLLMQGTGGVGWGETLGLT